MSRRNRLGPAETIDGPRRRQRRAQVLEAPVNAQADVVQHIGANLTLDRGIRAIDERIGQRRPRIIGHADDHLNGRCRRDRGASRSATLFTRGSSTGLLALVRQNHVVLPEQVVCWVQDAVGSGSRITRAKRLRLGGWHVNHALDVLDSRGRTHRLTEIRR
jgi:hypothetical protein